MRDDAILCSNTSTIPITQLAAGLEHPERFCGLHFFNPVRQMPLVEVIRGKKTSDATIATAVAYAKALGKSPIVMNDGPGFLVNRLLLPYMNEAALLLVRRGRASTRSIEPPSRSACRWGRSRCTTWWASTWRCTPAARWSRRFPIASCRPPIRAEARRARPHRPKGRQGLLRLRSGERRQAAARHRQRRGGRADRRSAAPARSASSQTEELTDRLFLPMLVEATRVLEDGIVRDVRDVDLAPDLRHRLSTVPRRPVLLGRPGRPGENRRKTKAIRSRSASDSKPRAMLTAPRPNWLEVLRLEPQRHRGHGEDNRRMKVNCLM